MTFSFELRRIGFFPQAASASLAAATSLSASVQSSQLLETFGSAVGFGKKDVIRIATPVFKGQDGNRFCGNRGRGCFSRSGLVAFCSEFFEPGIIPKRIEHGIEAKQCWS